ncbi:MAG: DUF3482 domain-containing protein [Halioglobus sp.]
MSPPIFAVVGRPNKGKSSIVATLARDQSVHIDSKAGSTRNARRFPMQVDGEILYELVDTPGIQRARAVVDWLETQRVDASERAATVAQFLEEHKRDLRFRDECQMLRPIMEGAGIIYVVDGSCPYGPDYEAEMEILRWTGQPSLAVINPIENADFVDEWKAGLGQYFQTVRVFNAHRAEPAKQLELLELFGHLDPTWSDSLSRAAEVLKADRTTQSLSSSFLIADLIIEALTYSVEQSVPKGAPEEHVKSALLLQYKLHLERQETNCRRQIEELYYHTNLNSEVQSVSIEESDLFNVDNWYLWGLKKWQMVSAAATVGLFAGGATGLAIDATHLGALGPVGTTISGVGGAITWATGSWIFADRIGKMKVKGIPSGGKRFVYGPTTNINFPFVLMGRGIRLFKLVSTRTHASQEKLDLDKPMLTFLSDKERRSLAKLFAKIQSGKKISESRADLSAMIFGWCEELDA